MLKIDKVHPMDEYMDLLSTSRTIYIDFERLNRAAREAEFLREDFFRLTELELQIVSDGRYMSATPENIIDCLYELGVDMDKRFRNKKVKGVSLSVKGVVEPLIEAGVTVDMLTAYKNFRSYKTYASFLQKLVSRQKIYKQLPNGRFILEFDTNLLERENLRVYYKDIAVVSIPKKYSYIVTTPSEDYHIAWCDYPQADWRFAYNLFIKENSNIEVMRQCEDAYEGLARLVEGDKFDPDAFKETRKDYKVSCLSTFYNSQDSRPIPSAMREYFHSMPRYQKYFYELGILQKFRLPIPVTSYFGYTQLIPEDGYPDAFISKGLNTPIQTFTSHIVNETVFGILERFWELGYTKDDINIYYVRHDEPLFLFKDTILKDAWVFEECSQIHIDGFTPISLEFHFGDFYKEENEQLSARIRREMKAYPDRIHFYKHGEAKDYNPIPSVKSVFVQMFGTATDGIFDGMDCYYYDYATSNRYKIHTRALTNEDALHESINEAVELLGNPSYLLVKTEFLNFMDKVGKGEATLMKVVAGYDSRVALDYNGQS